jgi:hypothetical protein
MAKCEAEVEVKAEVDSEGREIRGADAKTKSAEAWVRAAKTEAETSQLESHTKPR